MRENPWAARLKKTIKQHAKKVLIDQGIHETTKRGNKELNHLLKRLAQQVARTPSVSTQVGVALGEEIVE